MILHLLIHGQRTEKQFATYALQQFSALGVCSEFVFMSSNKEFEDYELFSGVKFIDPNKEEELSLLLDSLSEYSSIVFHGLFEPWCEVVLRSVPDRVKVGWVFWGGEIYGRKDLTDKFIAPRSRFVYKIRHLLNLVRGKQESHYEVPKNIYQRVDYCMTDMKEEYEFAKEYLNAPQMKFLWYNYYSIDKTIGDLADSYCNGSNIIVGNSASIECNFFDTFSIVRSNKRRSEYNTVLLSCSTMVQPHYRPQAQGNIITGLWLGMCVYLSEKSFAYQYFKRIGIQVYSIERDLRNGFLYSPERDWKTIERNRSVLRYWYGEKEMKSRNMELVSVLEGE